MHPEVREWVARHAPTDPVTVVEFGGADINGGVKDLFHPDSDWTSVDICDGQGVDVVADATTYRHPGPVDVVVCCEVAEHCENWPDLLANATRLLAPGGVFIFTAATHGRSPHGAWGAPTPHVDEWYANIDPADLETHAAEFATRRIDVTGRDIRMIAHV